MNVFFDTVRAKVIQTAFNIISQYLVKGKILCITKWIVFASFLSTCNNNIVLHYFTSLKRSDSKTDFKQTTSSAKLIWTRK